MPDLRTSQLLPNFLVLDSWKTTRQHCGRELTMRIWSVPNGIKRGDLLGRLYSWQHCCLLGTPHPGPPSERDWLLKGRAVGERLLKSKAVCPVPHSPTGRLPMARLVHNVQRCRGEKEDISAFLTMLAAGSRLDKLLQWNHESTAH